MPETRWPAALGHRGVVASPHPLATIAGLDVLEPWSDTAGHAQAVELAPGGLRLGGGDPRADGPALGI